jgi:hypothetical protein
LGPAEPSVDARIPTPEGVEVDLDALARPLEDARETIRRSPAGTTEDLERAPSGAAKLDVEVADPFGADEARLRNSRFGLVAPVVAVAVGVAEPRQPAADGALDQYPDDGRGHGRQDPSAGTRELREPAVARAALLVAGALSVHCGIVDPDIGGGRERM